MKRTLFGLFMLLCTCVSYAQINSSSFAPKVDLAMGSDPIFISVNDFDGDGKSDLAAVTFTYFSVFRNTAVMGAISSSSFAARQDFATAASTLTGPTIVSGDLDGDNKPDVVTPQFIGNGLPAVFSVFRNTSSSGAVSFATRQDFATSSSPDHVTLKDMDGDGKLDLICSMWWLHAIRVYRNTSTLGNISFDMSFFTASTGTNSYPGQIACEDYNQDGKVDIAVTNQGNATWSLFRNTSTPGSLSFASSGVLNASSAFGWGLASDMDGDNKPDLLASISSPGSIGLFRNTSTLSAISFSSQVTFSTAITNGPGRLSCADFDLDGKMDITVGNFNSSTMSVFKNFSSPGNINTNSLAMRKEFATGGNPAAHVADIDGDGKMDIVTANSGSASLSVLRNQIIPSNGLVAWYAMETNARDSSGFENHGTGNGITSTPDRYEKSTGAYLFDGTTSDYITVPANTSFNPANTPNMVFSIWFKADASPTNLARRLFSLENVSNDNFELSFDYALRKLQFINFNGSSSTSNVSVFSTTTFNANTWNHVVVRIDSANNTTLFVNGVQEVNSTNTILRPVNPILNIGKHRTQNWNFIGSLDDFKIYNKYSSNAAVFRLYETERGKTYYTKSSGNLNQLATWGTNTDGSGTSPLSFDSSNVTYYVRNNTSPALGGSLKIAGTKSTLVLGDGINIFNLAVNASDTLSCDSIYLNNNITLTIQGRFQTSKLDASASSAVQYISTSAQNMAAGIYGTLVVSSSAKTLSGNIVIRSTLGMLNSIHTNGFNLTLGTDAVNRGSLNRTQGTITGKFTRWFADAVNTGATGLFPVGTPAKYAPFNIEFTSAPTSGGTATVEFVPSSPGTTGLPVYDISNGFIFIDKAAIDGYWKTTSTIGSGTFTTTCTANGFTGVNNYANIRMLKRATGGSWAIPGTALTTTGNNFSMVLGRSGLNGLESEYGVGGDQSENPLPVTWLSFNGKQLGEDVELNWHTASEINNKRFEVQRSVNGSHFETIDFVNGNGNTKAISRYTYTDKGAFANYNGNLYYRLRQLDINGAVSLINTVVVSGTMPLNTLSFSIYPNPTNNFIVLKGLEQPALVYDATGNKVMIIESNGTSDFSALANGVYFIRSGVFIQKLVKQ